LLFPSLNRIRWELYEHEQIKDYRFKLKYDYGAWTEQILQGQSDGHIWNGYIVTFMFNHIPGTYDHKCRLMENAIERAYATLIRHVVHNPRSQSGRKKLLILYAFPDYPRTKMEPFKREDVSINDGLHYHGIVLTRIDTRLKVGLDRYIKENDQHFVSSFPNIRPPYRGARSRSGQPDCRCAPLKEIDRSGRPSLGCSW